MSIVLTVAVIEDDDNDREIVSRSIRRTKKLRLVGSYALVDILGGESRPYACELSEVAARKV